MRFNILDFLLPRCNLRQNCPQKFPGQLEKFDNKNVDLLNSTGKSSTLSQSFLHFRLMFSNIFFSLLNYSKFLFKRPILGLIFLWIWLPHLTRVNYKGVLSNVLVWFDLLSMSVKGQLISKANCQAEDSSKNERMNSFLLVCDVFSFVFWKNPRPEKNVSRLSDF